MGPATAGSILEGQIIKSDLTLTKDQSPYQVKGLLQISEGVTLRIGPGVSITFQKGSGIKNFGTIFIGDTRSSERVLLVEDRLPFDSPDNESLISGGNRSSVYISNAELVSKNRDSLVLGCLNLSIENSTIIGFGRFVYQQECQNFSLHRSYISNVRYLYTCAFDGHPDTFIVRDNIFEGPLDFCLVPDRTFHTGSFTNVPNAKTIYEVTGNDFEILNQIHLPVGYDEFNFTSNNLRKVENIKLFSFIIPGKPVITDLKGNYWSAATNESGLKSKVKVVDADTDITLKDLIVLTPLLSTPIQLNAVAKEQQALYKKDFKSKITLSRSENSKKSTITCTRGKIVKKVTAIRPKCPSGYKKK